MKRKTKTKVMTVTRKNNKYNNEGKKKKGNDFVILFRDQREAFVIHCRQEKL